MGDRGASRPAGPFVRTGRCHSPPPKVEQELLVPGRGTGGATPAWRGATSLLCVPFWKPASSLQLQTTKGLRISAPSSAHSARQCTPRAVLPAGTVCLLSDRRETWGQCPRGPHALCGLSTGQSAAHTPIPWRMGTERPFPFTCKKRVCPAQPDPVSCLAATPALNTALLRVKASQTCGRGCSGTLPRRPCSGQPQRGITGFPNITNS